MRTAHRSNSDPHPPFWHLLPKGEGFTQHHYIVNEYSCGTTCSVFTSPKSVNELAS